jgi:hypothetical protein
MNDGPDDPLHSSGDFRDTSSSVVWNWRNPTSAEPAAQSHVSRRRGALQSLIGFSIATILFLLGHRILAFIGAGISTLTLLIALTFPRALYARWHDGVARLGSWVGAALSWVLLVPTYYLIFLPFGLLLRRGSRDSMERSLDPDADSYWKPRRSSVRGAERFERQF